jgi:uncharacterized protein
MPHIFDCHRCGACCKLTNLSEQGTDLDISDGVCRHFDELNNICKIYETRPEICNVSVMYEKFYKSRYDWTTFSQTNQEICQHLENVAKSKIHQC